MLLFRPLLPCVCGVLISGCASNGIHPISIETASHDFEEAVTIVQKNYVDQVDVAALVNSAIAGMYQFAGVAPGTDAMPDDPMQRFSQTYGYLLNHSAKPPVTPEMQLQHHERPVAVDQVDIGLILTQSGEWIRISAVVIDSTAEAAGLNRGDAIIAIDGQSTAGRSLSWCYEHLSGAKGTVVEVTVNTEEGEVVDYRIVRIPVRHSHIVMLP